MVWTITASAGAGSSFWSGPWGDCGSDWLCGGFTTDCTTFSSGLLLACYVLYDLCGGPVGLLITQQVCEDLVVSNTAHELVLYYVVGVVNDIFPRTLAQVGDLVLADQGSILFWLCGNQG